MFVLVLLFCVAGDPAGPCVKATIPPMPMPSAKVCYAIAPSVAAFMAEKDGLLDRGFIPTGAQCFEKIPAPPDTES